MKIHFLLGSLLVVGTSLSSYNDHEKDPLNGRTRIEQLRKMRQELKDTCGPAENGYHAHGATEKEAKQDCKELVEHQTILLKMLHMNEALPNSPEGKKEVFEFIGDLIFHRDS